MNDQVFDAKAWRSALLWKEFRQVTPLATTVLMLGLGMLLLILITTSFTSPPFLDANQVINVFLSVPMIYACGVGILLVGAEKESRSLRWFQSLPVTSRDVARTKCVVALVSLAAIWIVTSIAWILFAAIIRIEPNLPQGIALDGVDSSALMLSTYVAVSIFLCLAGLGLSWYVQSSMVSLLLLIPSALAVWLPAYGFAMFSENLKRNPLSQVALDSGAYLACLAMGCAVALALGWIASQRELSARAAPRPASRWLGLVETAMRSESGTDAWSLWPNVSAGTGMLWQMVRQSWMLWFAVGSFCVLWLWIAAPVRLFNYSDNYLAGNVISRDSSVPMWMIGSLLILWMGVYAYQGDGIAQRVRFYADRGVSPSLLWWTRHWIPLTILLGLGLVRYCTLRPDTSLDLIETFAGLGLLLAIYITGQWVSQLIASPIISAIAAPIAAVAMGFFCISAMALMGAPWWSFIVTFAILLAATWWMMKPWMERRIDWKYYLQHGTFAAIAFTIPWLQGIWEVGNMPSMPSATRAELVRLAHHVSTKTPATRTYLLNFADDISPSTDASKSDNTSVARLIESNEQVRQSYRQILTRRAGDIDFWLGGLNGIPYPVAIFKAELSSLRNQITSEPRLPPESASSAIDDYRAILSHVPQIVKALRSREELQACDLAERIELLALRECLQPQSREAIGDELYQSLLKLLANGQSRDDARRKALASDWYDQSLIDSRSRFFSPNRLGAYYLDFVYSQTLRATGAIPLGIRFARERDLYVARLWDLLESAPGSSEAKAKRAIHREQFLVQRDDLCDVVNGVALVSPNWYEPGITWRGEWETIAEELNSKGQNRE